MLYNRIVKVLADFLKVKPKDARKYVIESFKPEFGDFSITALVSKDFKDKVESLEILREKLLKLRGVKRVEFVKGYVNIFIDGVWAVNKKEKVKKEDKKIMVEFSSPNSNKPLHLGHVRNTILGFSLSRLLSKKYDVIKANLINDRGIHICKAMLGYEMFSEFKTPEDANMKSDHFVGYCYVLFNKAEKERQELKKLAEDCLKKLELKDKETRELWKKINKWAINGIKQTYKRMGIDFDVFFYESQIYNKGKKLIFDAYKKGIVKRDKEGNYYVDLNKYNLPNKVVLRKDGTSIYITQDLYLAKHKFEKFGLDYSIYCVGSEQNLYFKQLFAIFREFGFDFWNKVEHFSYGMIYLPTGKMKSREGTVIDADNFFDDVEKKVENIVREKWPELGGKEVRKRVKKIAKAAINYAMLKYDPKKDFIFEFDKNISFEGNSGPYLLYTYARINSLLKRMARFKIVVGKSMKRLITDEEELIARQIGKLGYKIEVAIEKRALHLLIGYITQLANLFNSFYAKHRIITNKIEMKQRMHLLKALKRTFEDVFWILGIDPLERM